MLRCKERNVRLYAWPWISPDAIFLCQSHKATSGTRNKHITVANVIWCLFGKGVLASLWGNSRIIQDVAHYSRTPENGGGEMSCIKLRHICITTIVFPWHITWGVQFWNAEIICTRMNRDNTCANETRKNTLRRVNYLFFTRLWRNIKNVCKTIQMHLVNQADSDSANCAETAQGRQRDLNCYIPSCTCYLGDSRQPEKRKQKNVTVSKHSFKNEAVNNETKLYPRQTRIHPVHRR